MWISFSDLMVALLTVFMLAAAALVFSLGEEQAALAESRAEVEEAQTAAEAATARSEQFDTMLDSLGAGEQMRGTMVIEIRDALGARGIQVDVDASNTVLRVPVDLLGFDSGSSEISSEHEANAVVIGKVITEVLRKDDRYLQLDTVFVEGHTDDVPMDGTFGGNWGLSPNRAIALWRLWEDELPTGLNTLSGYSGERLFSVSGYAESRPVGVTQVTAEDRAANRRIDIRFTEHRLSEAEISALQAATVPADS